MRITGLAISAGLHIAIIGWAVVTVSAIKPKPVPIAPRIQVEILTVDQLTRIKAGQKKPQPKKKPVKKTEKPKPKKADKPKPKKIAAVPPSAKPAAVLAKKPDVKKPKPKIVPKKKKVAPKKPDKPKKKLIAKKKVIKKKPKKAKKKEKFDPDSIAALLNKIPDAKSTGGAKKKPVKKPKKVKPLAELGQANGIHDRLTINEFDFFVRQIGQCWSPPVGAANAQTLIPVIQFKLKKSGEIEGIPKVINKQNSPFFSAAARAAISAVVDCAPYALPRDKYVDWRDNEIEFDPIAMFGG